jgi:hypothetical protein
MTNEQIDKIYNSFSPDKRDMSREAFKKEIRNLTDPVKMEQDLANIEILKARERTNKIRIDRSLRRK